MPTKEKAEEQQPAEGIEPEAKTEPTEVETLRSQLQEEAVTRKKMEDNWKNAQRRETEKSNRIHELETQIQSTVSKDEYNTLRIELASLQDSREAGEDYDKPASLKVKQLQTELKAEQEREKQERQWGEFRARVNALQQKAIDAGLDPDDEAFDPVVTQISLGNLDKAEKRLEKILGKKESPMKETEEAMKARIKAEIIKEYGLGSDEIGSGAASKDKSTFSRTQIKDPDFYQANKEKILKAQEEGRIID